jgi:hypothetical protein
MKTQCRSTMFITYHCRFPLAWLLLLINDSLSYHLMFCIHTYAHSTNGFGDPILESMQEKMGRR